MKKSTYKKALYNQALPHIAAQFKSDGDIDRFRASVLDMIEKADRAWKAVKEPMWSEVNDRSIPDSFFLKQRLNPLPDTVLSGTITNTADASDVGSFGEMVSKPSVNWYDKVGENSALDWIDPIRPKKGMAPVHIDWSTATLDDVPVDWMPIAEGMDYWDEYAQKKPFYMGVPILGRMFPNERLAKRYIESINKAHDTTVIPDLQERWVPEYWQTCWTFSADGTIPMNWAETEQQLKCLRFGSVFRTQAEAQSAAEKVKALLLSL